MSSALPPLTSPLFSTLPLGPVFGIPVGPRTGNFFFLAFIQRFANPNPSVRRSVRTAFLLGNFAPGDCGTASHAIHRKSAGDLISTTNVSQLKCSSISRVIYLGICLYNLTNCGAPNIGSLNRVLLRSFHPPCHR